MNQSETLTAANWASDCKRVNPPLTTDVQDPLPFFPHGLCAGCACVQISGVKVFGSPDRLVFYREASTGLSKQAYFWALDLWSYVGMVLRCGVYLIMYYTYSQPRAVVWQLYVITMAIYFACQGQAFLLSQVRRMPMALISVMQFWPMPWQVLVEPTACLVV